MSFKLLSSTSLFLLTALSSLSCGNDDSDSARDARGLTSSSPAESSDSGTGSDPNVYSSSAAPQPSVSSSTQELEVPSVRYYQLTAALGRVHFEVDRASCLYVRFASDGSRRLALFPPRTTYAPSTGVLTISGSEPQKLRIDTGKFDGGGGGLNLRSLRREGASVDLKGCSAADGVHQVWGLERL